MTVTTFPVTAAGTVGPSTPDAYAAAINAWARDMIVRWKKRGDVTVHAVEVVDLAWRATDMPADRDEFPANSDWRDRYRHRGALGLRITYTFATSPSRVRIERTRCDLHDVPGALNLVNAVAALHAPAAL